MTGPPYPLPRMALGPATAPSRLPLRAQRLFVPWLLLCAVCAWLMWNDEIIGEVVPFHLVWIGFALIYGFEPWPVRQTLSALGGTTVLLGAVMVQHSVDGTLPLEELAEIPLMLVLCLLVAWHVHRRDAATERAAGLARREVAAAADRERLARLTSHEMRTPLTIATGYLDLVLDTGPADGAHRADLVVVRDELGRLARVADRLVRRIRLQDLLPLADVDVDAMMTETAQRFSALAERRWTVESDVGVVRASVERLRGCLDTLIENALRYTEDGDAVRLLAFRTGEDFWLGVGDSGPGLTPALARAVNSARRPRSSAPTDVRSQTGLGLDLVRDVVEARRGRLYAGRSREGGALLLARLPSVPPADHLATPVGHQSAPPDE